jgi:hypothetical protein
MANLLRVLVLVGLGPLSAACVHSGTTNPVSPGARTRLELERSTIVVPATEAQPPRLEATTLTVAKAQPTRLMVEPTTLHGTAVSLVAAR